jgi:hypothetical protein
MVLADFADANPCNISRTPRRLYDIAFATRRRVATPFNANLAAENRIPNK